MQYLTCKVMLVIVSPLCENDESGDLAKAVCEVKMDPVVYTVVLVLRVVLPLALWIRNPGLEIIKLSVCDNVVWKVLNILMNFLVYL